MNKKALVLILFFSIIWLPADVQAEEENDVTDRLLEEISLDRKSVV